MILQVIKSSFFLIVLSTIVLFGCNSEGFFDPIDESKFQMPRTDGLHAPEFPTPTGAKWQYQNVENPDQRHQLSVTEETRFDAGFTFRQMTSKYENAENPGGELYLFDMDQEFDRILDELSRIELPEFEEGKEEEELNTGQLDDLAIKRELEALIVGIFNRNGIRLPDPLTIKKANTPSVQATAGDWLIQDIFKPYIIRRETNQLSVYTRQTTDHLSSNGCYFRQNGKLLVGAALPIYATYFFKSSTEFAERAFDLYFGSTMPPIMHNVHPNFRKLWVFPLRKDVEWTVLEQTVSPTVRVKRRVVDDQVSISVPAGYFTDGYLVEEIIEGKEAFTSSSNESTKLEDLRDNTQPPDDTNLLPAARYWVIPHVGVVKYEYFPTADQPVTYELISYQL